MFDFTCNTQNSLLSLETWALEWLGPVTIKNLHRIFSFILQAKRTTVLIPFLSVTLKSRFYSKQYNKLLIYTDSPVITPKIPNIPSDSSARLILTNVPDPNLVDPSKSVQLIIRYYYNSKFCNLSLQASLNGQTARRHNTY